MSGYQFVFSSVSGIKLGTTLALEAIEIPALFYAEGSPCMPIHSLHLNNTIRSSTRQV